MDRRLIQTAVFGSPDSDDPALCPETPEELEAFRREHEGVTIRIEGVAAPRAVVADVHGCAVGWTEQYASDIEMP
ncbi:hypothetical protein [Streptomyces sp. NPDC047981]|uniref:hypothetical protein n=1 Tax=Streptomyces sp. NPDC047981 TaxID=3154610 RepID=UPI0034251815